MHVKICAGKIRKKMSIDCWFLSASQECSVGYTRCQGADATRSCVRTTWLCDGDNDCGNNWDENPAQCGQYIE